MPLPSPNQTQSVSFLPRQSLWFFWSWPLSCGISSTAQISPMALQGCWRGPAPSVKRRTQPGVGVSPLGRLLLLFLPLLASLTRHSNCHFFLCLLALPCHHHLSTWDIPLPVILQMTAAADCDGQWLWLTAESGGGLWQSTAAIDCKERWRETMAVNGNCGWWWWRWWSMAPFTFDGRGGMTRQQTPVARDGSIDGGDWFIFSLASFIVLYLLKTWVLPGFFRKSPGSL